MKKIFHPSVIKKDLLRFAPLWGLYTVFMLIFLVLFWEASGASAYFFNSAQDIMAVMGTVNIIYGGICALVLFGDLFDPRLCNMLHAMPLSREGWFFSHLASGLLFCLIPSAVGTLVSALMLEQYAYGALLWLALTVMQFLFFFGVGAFSVMCTGNKLGAVAVYLLVNYFSLLIGALIKALCEPLLYGITVELSFLSRLCPSVGYVDTDYILTHYDNMRSVTVLDGIPGDGWIYAGITAAVGGVFLTLALLIYRKRHMETAGDLISFRPLAPVILVIYALCVGVFLHTVGTELELAPWLLFGIGLAIGYFTGRMLLEKQVKVFRVKNFLGFGALVLASAAVLLTVRMDPVGITRYVPEAEQVESVTVSPYSSRYSIHSQSIRLDAPEDVAAILQLHQDALSGPGQYDYVPVHLRYRLKSGITVDRDYRLPAKLGYDKLLKSLYSRPACVMLGLDMETVLQGLTNLELYAYDEAQYPYVFLTGTEPESYALEKFGDAKGYVKSLARIREDPVAQALVKAIYADCEAGRLSQWQNDADSMGHIDLRLQTPAGYVNINIIFYDSCENILSVLATVPTEDKFQSSGT